MTQTSENMTPPNNEGCIAAKRSQQIRHWLNKPGRRFNSSPEPTAVPSNVAFAKADGAVSSAVAVPVAGRRWLSFFR